MDYYAATAAAAQQAALFRAQAAAREAYLLRKATDAQARLRTAEEAYEQGEIRVATRILLAVAKSEVPNPIRLEARKRLGQLGDEARQKFQEIEGEFQTQRAELSPGEASYASRWPELVRDAFQKYEDLTDDYGAVPKTGREIESQVARKRRLPEYAEVLNEPESAALWQLGQEHEQQDHACCAYWVYQGGLALVAGPLGPTCSRAAGCPAARSPAAGSGRIVSGSAGMPQEVPRRRADPGQEPRPGPAASGANRRQGAPRQRVVPGCVSTTRDPAAMTKDVRPRTGLPDPTAVRMPAFLRASQPIGGRGTRRRMIGSRPRAA